MNNAVNHYCPKVKVVHCINLLLRSHITDMLVLNKTTPHLMVNSLGYV